MQDIVGTWECDGMCVLNGVKSGSGQRSWGMYMAAEEVEALVEGVYPMGNREGQLLESLQPLRVRIKYRF